jgi:hypothetical protein
LVKFAIRAATTTTRENLMKRLQELKQRFGLALRILRGRDGNLVQHALTELQAAGHFDGDRINALAANDAVDLVRVFSTQGHSGFSASFMRHLFDALAAYKPLGPLTGADSEWMDVAEVSGMPMWQNRRCGHVFRDGDGQAYDIDAVIFEEPSCARFTGRFSRQFITFPYTPRHVIVQVPDDATDLDKQLAAQAAWSQA